MPPLEELVLHFQPIMALESERIVGFEALIRWQHPDRGLLFPASFLPLSEETGFIVEIDKWCLRQAVGQLKAWQDRFPTTLPLRMSVNTSAGDLHDESFFETVSGIETLKAMAGGVLSMLAYGVIIWALTLAPMGQVSALRETSILFAAVIGVVFLKEKLTPARVTAALMIAGGAVALSAAH